MAHWPNSPRCQPLSEGQSQHISKQLRGVIINSSTTLEDSLISPQNH